jgi:outer membrane protein, heavy metal efflux system
MPSRLSKWSPWALVMLLAAGCCFPVRQKADQFICDMALQPIDLAPATNVDELPPMPPAQAQESTDRGESGVRPVSAQEPEGKETKPKEGRSMAERLPVPPELPGGDTPRIQLPEDPAKQPAYLNRLLPQLPVLGPDVQPAPGPDGHPLTLAQFQQMALTNSPLIRQAAADVEAARGAFIQAGAYPNPTLGLEDSSVGQSSTAGQPGAFIEQLIKTGGKLELAQAAAAMDLRNSQIALNRAQSDLATQVRTNYFALLVAQENVKITRSLVRFTDEVYNIQSEQVKHAQAAAYEPLQLRVLAFQARASLVQARNRYVSIWKQLAAALGLPGLPFTQVEGRVDMPLPLFQYDEVLAHVLTSHTDVATAKNTLQRARYNLRLAQVTPVPDVLVHVGVDHDYTGDPKLIQANVTVGVPVPIWDHNKGGIMQAQGQLLRAVEEEHRVRDDLSTRLADAFERYRNNRQILEYYRTHILPDQVRAYRGV